MDTSVDEIDRRALYNALRMNWLLDRSIEVEEWQVINYRELSEEALLKMLQDKGIKVDSKAYLVFAEAVDSPEELTDLFLINFEGDVALQDQIYLIVFELWRRLIPEKLCFSIFCDELDHQICAYDELDLQDFEQFVDTLSNLKMVLDENVDSGVKPKDIFDSLAKGCANDVESFIYDFIAELIDNENITYAFELLDDFSIYLADNKWFELLRARVIEAEDSEAGSELMSELAIKASRQQDLEFNLEILSAMIHVGDCEIFAKLAKKSFSLLSSEEELQDLLSSCIEFFRCRDCEDEQEILQDILDRRTHFDPDTVLNLEDEDLIAVKKVIK